MNYKSLVFAVLCTFFASCNNSSKDTPHPPSLHIAMTTDPTTVDPRRGRSIYSAQLIHTLFEGLMGFDSNGKLIPAGAESVEASMDLKTYTFKIRPNHWSNGKPVTSYDYAYTLRSSLDPNFPAPNAYQLFDIVNAREIKEGKKPIEALGIETPDKDTLVIHLEQPHTYFLELTAFYAFFPVNEENDKKHPSWPDGPAEEVVSNGPFKLIDWKHNQSIKLEKNPYYWDGSHIRINRLQFSVIDGNTALQLFEQEKLDWIGSPLSAIPSDVIPGLKAEDRLSTSPAAGTYWIRFNTQNPPLNNVKFRLALSYAINRKQIVKHIVQGNQIPTTGIVPPSFTNYHPPYFKDHDTVLARRLFQEALIEMNLTIDNFPQIVLAYGNDEILHKVAQYIQNEWQSTFPLPQGTFLLQRLEPKVLSQDISLGNYQLAMGSWFADFKDPTSFLNVFKFASNGTNNTGWENKDYIKFLDKAGQERDPVKRRELLERAEQLLVSEMPIAPLFHASYNYAKNPKVKGAYLSELGYIDFKNTYIGAEERIADEDID